MKSDDATLAQVKAEFAQGKKLLASGDWGYSKEPWQKEFDAFQQSLEKPVPRTSNY